MKDLKLISMLILLILIPYKYIGFNFGNIITVCILLFIITFKKKIKYDKNLIIIMLFFIIYGFVHTLFFNNTIEGLVALAIYISYIVFYLFWKSVLIDKQVKEKIIKYIVNINTIAVIFFIFIERIYRNGRLNGNIGYANTYALILFITIYLNSILIKENNIKNIILYIGIFFTGSRTTIIFSIIFIIFNIIKSKKHFNKKQVIDLLVGWIIFCLIKSAVMIFILIMPILYFIIKNLYKSKIKMVNIFIILFISIGITLIYSNNTFDRIKNISPSNGSLQERFIMFEDITNNVVKNPIGEGIGNYRYNIQSQNTAFYTAQYAHNSVLQIAYELGILGAILFVIMIGYMGYKIYKRFRISKELIIFLLIIAHSMINFDFSFSIIIGFFMFLYNIWIDEEENSSINLKIISIIFCSMLFIISIFEFRIWLSDYLNKTGNYKYAINSLSKMSNVPDKRIPSILGEAYINKYEETKNKDDIENAINNLNASYKNDFAARRNLVYALKVNSQEQEAINVAKDIIKRNKYNKIDYQYFYDLIKEMDDYNNVIWIENYYNKNIKTLNEKSVYLNDQLQKK